MVTNDITPWWYAPGTSDITTSMKDGTTHAFTPPTPGACLFGAGIANDGSETSAGALARYTTNIGAAPQICRCFDGVAFTGDSGSNGPTRLLDAMVGMGLGTIPQVGSLSSWALANLAAIASGSMNSTFDSLLTSISSYSLTSTSQVRLLLVHEPDLSSKQTTLGGWSGYESVNSVLNARIAAHGDANIIPIEILTGASLSTRLAAANSASVFSHGTQEVWTDPYQDYLGYSGSFQTAASLIQPQHDEIISFFGGSMKYGIGEIGPDHKHGVAQSDQVTFIDGIGAYCPSTCVGVTWYNFSATYDDRIDTDAIVGPAWSALF